MSSVFIYLVAFIPRDARSSAIIATEKIFPVTEKGHSLTRKLFVATWAASLVATPAIIYGV
jgi:hypothetical protein